jgi:MOSC domain-containing protein
MSTENISASIVSVVRYPFKSMMGEELSVADVNENGLLGDRACALIDNSTGKIASAKNPRKWARLFDCHANFVEPPRKGHPASSVDHAAREFLLPLGTSRPRRTVNTAALLIQLIPNFKNIRADLHYADLLRRMGLPQSPLPTPS